MKRIISIISVITLLCTMFSVPAMAEDTTENVIEASWPQVKIEQNINDNAVANGFVLADGHVLAESENGNGTFINSGHYYKVYEADALGSPKARTGLYAETTGKTCVMFNAYKDSVFNSQYVPLTYGENDRLFYSAYINNIAGTKVGLGFMTSSAGVVMSNWTYCTFPTNKWSKLDVIYDPNVTYTFTVDGVEYTASSLGKALPLASDLGYQASSADNADNASAVWSPILALADMTFDASKTYVINSVEFGEGRYYVDGKLIGKSTGSYTYTEDGDNFYFYSALPTRFVFNGASTLSISNSKFGKISNFDEATFDFGQPETSAVAGERAPVGGKLYIKGDTVSKSELSVPEGAVIKAYENAAASPTSLSLQKLQMIHLKSEIMFPFRRMLTAESL